MNDLFAFGDEQASNISIDKHYLLKPFLDKESFNSGNMQAKLQDTDKPGRVATLLCQWIENIIEYNGIINKNAKPFKDMIDKAEHK